MKYIALIVVLLLPSLSLGDQLIQMSNGMTCWQNNSGHIYGCSGGSNDSGDTGFNDVYSGRRYEYTDQGRGGAYDTGTGSYFSTPYNND